MIDMIPIQVDLPQIIADLHSWGWRDYKIEVACGLGSGYIAQVRCGNIREPSYGKAARLYNFWMQQALLDVSRGTLHHRTGLATTA